MNIINCRLKPLLAIAAIAGISSLMVGCGGGDSTSSPVSSPVASSLQVAPGTSSRPILSASEVANYTVKNYFAQSGNYAAPVAAPWTPTSLAKGVASLQPNFIVSPNSVTYDTLQKAINAAVLQGGTNTISIEVMPGTYNGVVYVPAGAPPIMVYGAGNTPDQVVIQSALDAYWTQATYAQAVNPSNQFVSGDPAWSMYNACVTQTATKIDTPCSAVVWAQSNGFQLYNLTITNTMPVAATSHQAVALRTDGDKTQLENVRLIGGQDTFFVNAGDPATPTNKMGAYQTTRISRAYVKNSYIEGDIDFVFGRANAVFDTCVFKAVSARGTLSANVFAPDTVPAYAFGFLVINSSITGDTGFQNSGQAHLGRSWDQGTSGTGYIAGSSPNGQIVIRDSSIDSSFNTSTPWNAAATSGRAFSADTRATRNLLDPLFNHLWEYNNIGKGTGF